MSQCNKITHEKHVNLITVTYEWKKDEDVEIIFESDIFLNSFVL